MKAGNPEQLALSDDIATSTHIGLNSPQIKEELGNVGRSAIAEAARETPSERPFDDFDWANDPSVILQEQRATAIYKNKYDGVVIRQERSWDEESDPFLVIAEHNCATFLDRLCDLMGIPSAGGGK